MVSFVSSPQIAPLAPVQMDPSDRLTLQLVISRLLCYPDEASFEDRLQACRSAVQTLSPSKALAPVEVFLEQAGQMGQRRLAEHYVDVFDSKRRCCLYLSYYAVGDTRYRGAALLMFREALAASGWEVCCDELPDFLPLILEFSARSDDEVASLLLVSHREGIEVLRSALTREDSIYKLLLDALTMILPEMDESQVERMRKLILAGPPTETVGVTTVLPFPSVPIKTPELIV